MMKHHELCPSRMGSECICFEIRSEAWDECVAVFEAKYFGGPTKNMVLGWLTNPYRKGEIK